MPVLEITTRIGCKIHCSFCPQDKLKEAYTARSGSLLFQWKPFKTCLDKLPAGTGIHFSGMSEPWLHPECTEMVLYAAAKGHPLKASSTLVGMNPDDVGLLEKASLPVFNVHLPSEDAHAELFPLNDNYFTVLERLLESRLSIEWRFLGEKIHPKVLPYVRGKKIRRIRPHSRAGNIKVLEGALPGTKKGKTACRRGLKQNVLLPNGDVVLCCMDYGMKHILGNLVENSYASLFQSEEFKKVKHGLTDPSVDILCRSCEDFAYAAHPVNAVKQTLHVLRRRLKGRTF